jgi:hypothetical protein
MSPIAVIVSALLIGCVAGKQFRNQERSTQELSLPDPANPKAGDNVVVRKSPSVRVDFVVDAGVIKTSNGLCIHSDGTYAKLAACDGKTDAYTYSKGDNHNIAFGKDGNGQPQQVAAWESAADPGQVKNVVVVSFGAHGLDEGASWV